MIHDTTPYKNHSERVLSKLDPADRLTLSGVVIVENPRLRTTAGKAIYNPLTGGCRIEYNKELFKTMTEEKRYETVGHEMAHALCFKWGLLHEGHGKTWKFVMAQIGLEGERTHSLEVRRNTVRRWVFTLANGKVAFISPRQGEEVVGKTQKGVQFVGVIGVDPNERSYWWEKKCGEWCFDMYPMTIPGFTLKK